METKLGGGGGGGGVPMICPTQDRCRSGSRLVSRIQGYRILCVTDNELQTKTNMRASTCKKNKGHKTRTTDII